MKWSYCRNCGSSLGEQATKQRHSVKCPNCSYIDQDYLIVGAGAAIEDKSRLLLMRRSTDPFKGFWNLPAGHVNPDEPPEMAALREAKEETGLECKIISLQGVYFFDDHPKGCGIFIVYRCVIVGGSLRETDEAYSPSFFAKEEIPSDLAGGGHSLAIKAWQQSLT
jgi:8-oxo-dGTP diphosphatase